MDWICRGGGSGGGGEQGRSGLSSQGLFGGGRKQILGVRSQEQGFAASCGGHIWCLPRLTSRPTLSWAEGKRAPNERQRGRAADSHLFCFQHQRPKKRLSGPEGRGHPSWRLHSQKPGPHGQWLLTP